MRSWPLPGGECQGQRTADGRVGQGTSLDFLRRTSYSRRMSDTQQMKRLSVWVPAATVARLDKIAKRNADRGWKRADAIREALAEYVEAEDEQEDAS